MVPFIDLKRRYVLYQQEIDDVIKRVLKSGWFILGKELEQFEARLAEYLDVEHVIGVNSGTDAIFLALKAIGVQPGDEVITVANTATPTVSAIRMSGCRYSLI
jgi:dTDP-4-amino-4,6-dideoxygalactose transaminase